jgi:hypothetical protein
VGKKEVADQGLGVAVVAAVMTRSRGLGRWEGGKRVDWDGGGGPKTASSRKGPIGVPRRNRHIKSWRTYAR